MLEIYKDFHIEAAHYLPHVEKNHKCHNMHGHSYTIRVYISGDIDCHKGWIQDYSEISTIFKQHIFSKIDHACLNDLPGLENPTAENISLWVWNNLKDYLNLSAVEVQEGANNGCIYRPTC